MYRFIDYQKIFEQEKTGGEVSPEMMGQTSAQVTPANTQIIDLQVTDSEKNDLLTPGKVFTKAAKIMNGLAVQDIQLTLVIATSDADDASYPEYTSESNYVFLVKPTMLKTQLENLKANEKVMLTGLTNSKGASLPIQVSLMTATPQSTSTETDIIDAAANTGDLVGANPKKYEASSNTVKSFDSFVTEAKWIDKIDMKKGALKKKLGKEKLTAKDIKAAEAELEKKDKNKKKPGLQLDKKDSKTQKQLVLAKNLMKASGAMNESREGRIKGAKNDLLKLHAIVEKMITKTSIK